jgi:hypothetical protein
VVAFCLTGLAIVDRKSSLFFHQWHSIFRNAPNNNNTTMSTNKTLLIALGGAAAATLIYRYLGTEKGKELLNSASGLVKDLTSKATEYAKTNLGGAQSTDQAQAS